MKTAYGDSVQVSWKYFSLEQANNKQGPEWRLWDQPPDYPSRGIPAFLAAEAARRQGQDAYNRMHFALLEGRNERRKDFTEPGDLEEIARTAGLDMQRFRHDVADRQLLQRLAADHSQAVSQYGVFGTPTFVFENREAFFMRIKAPAGVREAVRILDCLVALFVDCPAVDEIKRPHKAGGA